MADNTRPRRTEERAEDLGLFYEKIVTMMDKKGLSISDALDVLTVALCDLAMNHEYDLNELIMEVTGRWESLKALVESKKKAPKLIRNRIKCLDCNDIIESTHVHDFKWCKCNRCFVDGGLEYLRRGHHDLSRIEDLSEWEEI